MYTVDDGAVLKDGKDTGFALTAKDGAEWLKKGKNEVRLPHLGLGTYAVHSYALESAIAEFSSK